MIEFVVSPVFSDKLPKLTDAEFNQLRDNILEDGIVKRPLVVWFGSLEGETESHYYLIDGHNRWKIIQENWEFLKDKFQIEIKEFANQYYAEAWMYKNQRGQRNLSDLWQDKINGEIVKAEIKAVGQHTGNQYTAKMEMDTKGPIPKDKPKSTVERVAKELNVPEGTLKKQLSFVRGLDAAEKVEPGFQNEILSGEVKTSKKAVRELRNMEPEERKKAIEEIRNPKPKEEKNPNIQPVGERKRFPKMTEEDRERMEFIHKINETQQDIDREIEYTVDDLVNEITVNGMNYVSSLRATLTKRQELFVGYEIDRITEAVNKLIAEIEKTKELIV